MRLKHLLASLVLIPVSAWADPQKDLCDAIKREDDIAIAKALSEGASLVKPCEKMTPLEVARDTGNKDLWAYLARLIDSQQGNPITRPPTPELQVEEILKDFVVLEDRTPKFRAVLPIYLTNQDKFLNGRVNYGEPIYALNKRLIQAPTTIEQKPYQQLLQSIAASEAVVKTFGATGKIDLAVFKNPDSLKKVYENLAILEKKHAVLEKYLGALESVRKNYTKYDNYDETGLSDTFAPVEKLSPFAIHFEELFKRVTEDAETIVNYTVYVLTLVSEPTIQQIEHLLGIKKLPEYYAEPIRSFMVLSAHDSSMVRLLVDEIVDTAKNAQGKAEKQLTKIANIMGYIYQRASTEISTKAPKLFQFLPRLLSVVVLSNTQFDTDATPSLLFPASESKNDKLNRAYKAEYQLMRLLALTTEEGLVFNKATAHLSKDEREGIEESAQETKTILGADGLKELKEHLNNAVSSAASLGFPQTVWTCPMPGLGALLHSSWFRTSVPSKASPAILKATRTLGMTRGMTVAFGSVEMDFTPLGPITREQAQSLIVFVQDVAEEKAVPESRRRGVEKLLTQLEKLFSAKQRVSILQITKSFADALEKEITKLHDTIKNSVK